MKDILITISILICILTGVLVGWSGIFPDYLLQKTETFTWWILYFLLFMVGIDLGLNKFWVRIKDAGYRMVILPIAVVIGTFCGAIIACLLLSYPLGQGLSVSAGFGWYTLTSLLLNRLHGAELGALGFLANVFREMITFLIIPIFHKMNKTVCGIASGGATTMDTTLVLIDKVAGPDYAAIAFIQGFICSLLALFLVPILSKF